MIWDVIIIGSGPAGLAAATVLRGLNVLLLEKENTVANKLRLSGAGQCNMTHSGQLEDFEDKYGDKWRFIRPSMKAYTNEDMIRYFKKQGCDVIVTDKGKVFPKSLKADDVIDVLIKDINSSIKINTSEPVIKLLYDDNYRIETTKSVYQSKCVIVATGGISYPKTGSTGDGLKFAKMLNVSVKPYGYALSPIYVKEHLFSELMGLSFENVSIDHFRGKKINTYVGDLLITHFGYSGPSIINASRWMEKSDRLYINFTSYKREELENDLLLQIKNSPKKTVRTLLTKYVQNRMVDKMLSSLSIDGQILASEFNKKNRKDIINMLTNYEVIIDQVGKSHIAMVSKGGISTTELSKKNFESKKYKGLYFVGECVDVDGDTGGYNIQFAFSSGIAAARHIKERFND
ncbi:MAG: aminoacetone oxidase family FAD-binding enzyme [Clostridiales bacterium]|nr:aminoacetone oxidase family FAD-binding enzyme [Clostridiales bacterium]